MNLITKIAIKNLLPGLLLITAVEANESAELYREAGHPQTSVSRLIELSLVKDASIRKQVASNRKTPKDVLLRLASDPDSSVKIAVATNLSGPDEMYIILARDPAVAVRSVVARFEYVPLSALSILANDEEVDIRLEVARNLNSDKVILTKLTQDYDSTVKAIAEQGLQRLRDEE
ncbi:MAG: hypothetical protein OEW97_05330 [Gammaproteobacteria bacterium]|nr:hypothetical protein [Gammaproteobacteria bacterium]